MMGQDNANGLIKPVTYRARLAVFSATGILLVGATVGNGQRRHRVGPYVLANGPKGTSDVTCRRSSSV